MLFSRIMLFPAMVLFLTSSYLATSSLLFVDSMTKTWVTTALSLFTVGLVLMVLWVLMNLSFFNVIIRERLSFGTQLKQSGYSEGAIEEIWKWYDSSEKKGVANW